MPDEKPPEGQGAKETPGEQEPIIPEVSKPEASPPAAPPSEEGEKKDPPDPIPYARFTEVNERMKKAELDLKALKADQEKIRTEKLKEQGKFGELLKEREGELESANKELEEFRADQTKRRDAILSELSDEDKKFAEENLPALSSLEEFTKRILQTSGGKTEPRPTAPGDKIEDYDSTWDDDKKAEWHKKTIEKYAAAK